MTVERCSDHIGTLSKRIAVSQAPCTGNGRNACTLMRKWAKVAPTCNTRHRGDLDMESVNSVLNKSASESVCWDFKLLAHHELAGFGGMGEGMAIQVAKDGRRIMWLAHESAPKNFTGVDVSDPRRPKLVVQTDLPESFMRSNSLELVGDIMAGAYQTPKNGQQPARSLPSAIYAPEKPKSVPSL